MKKFSLNAISVSTYTSYDAAVYAAANNYLQSKAQGTANIWMSSGKKTGTFGGANSSNISISGSNRGQSIRGYFLSFPVKFSSQLIPQRIE